MKFNLQNIKKFFSVPVFLINSQKEKWQLIVFLTLYIPLFLIIFQPFGVNNYDPSHAIRLEFLLGAAIFGLANFVALFLFEFVIAPVVFKKKSRFVFALRIISELIFLSITIYVTYNILGNFHDWSWGSFFGFIRDISFSAILPMTFIFLYFNYVRTKEDYEYLLELPKDNFNETDLIHLKADNGKDVISLSQKFLLFIEAQDNYVAIQYLDKGIPRKELLRTTMKDVEECLKPYSIVRCHRSFIVNLSNVERVTGNTHKLNLFLPFLKTPIPVSRSYVSQIETILDIRHK